MDDIAQAAGISRATLYRYFASKDVILERLSIRETERVHAGMLKHIERHDRAEDMLVECLLLATRTAHANPRLRALFEHASAAAQAANPRSPVHAVIRSSWGRLIAQGVERGELAGDLGIDAIIGWLVLSQGSLLAKVDAMPVDDADLRTFIRRFIVSPVLAR